MRWYTSWKAFGRSVPSKNAHRFVMGQPFAAQKTSANRRRSAAAALSTKRRPHMQSIRVAVRVTIRNRALESRPNSCERSLRRLGYTNSVIMKKMQSACTRIIVGNDGIRQPGWRIQLANIETYGRSTHLLAYQTSNTCTTRSHSSSSSSSL